MSRREQSKNFTYQGDDWPNYAKITWQYRQWFERYKRYVKVHGLLCQECGGGGGETVPVLDDGTGPFEMCGWCQGTGYVTRWIRGDWLRQKKLTLITVHRP